MTEKAQAILQKIRQRRALKHWQRFNTLKRRDRVLKEFNRDNLDDIGPIGGAEQGSKLLSQMHSLADEHDQCVKSLMPKVEVL